ncbi:hypothetical protein HA402_006021 [Bradysia odoriphaga]|nr:hypothetical protein HA402_006021 [Bradysia odoriphaga]
MKPTAKKSTKNAKKATKPADKPKARDIDAKMIIDTLNALKSAAADVENGRGFALVTIKKYITTTHGIKMGKERQASIKSVMEDEFVKGHIKMTNHDGDKINFLKRFDLPSDEEAADE